MKYKPGDKVKIKSLDWYKANECSGRVICDGLALHERMTEWCGKELTIDLVYTNDEGIPLYIMKEPKTQWRFTDGMIEGLANEPQEKMVSLDKVCEMLYSMLTTLTFNDYDYVTASAYDDVVEFVEDFRKKWD